MVRTFGVPVFPMFVVLALPVDTVTIVFENNIDEVNGDPFGLGLTGTRQTVTGSYQYNDSFASNGTGTDEFSGNGFAFPTPF